MAQLTATGISDRPMTVMIEPVTTGGKSRTSWAKNGAITQPDQPRDNDRRRRPAGNRPAAGDGDHGRDARERDALHQRQLGAEGRHAQGLQQGGQAADEESRRSTSRPMSAGGQAGGTADDQRRRDDAAVHGQDVLDAVGEAAPTDSRLVLGALAGARCRSRAGAGRGCRRYG